MPSVISKTLKIKGQLESSEDIQIDGDIEGDVRGINVKIGQNAKVKGTVYGDEVELAGTIEGKIEAKKVILTGTARMSGDVVHQDIKIESGAFIDGHLKPEFGKTGAKVATPSFKPVASVRSSAFEVEWRPPESFDQAILRAGLGRFAAAESVEKFFGRGTVEVFVEVAANLQHRRIHASAETFDFHPREFAVLGNRVRRRRDVFLARSDNIIRTAQPARRRRANLHQMIANRL